jgi:hypothetical protein
MTPDEYEIYLSLIQGSLGSRLGGGESAAIALASSRGYAIALDDNKARSVFRTRFNNSICVSSLKIFLSVANRDAWDIARIREVLNAATQNSRMAIPKDDRHLIESLANI